MKRTSARAVVVLGVLGVLGFQTARGETPDPAHDPRAPAPLAGEAPPPEFPKKPDGTLDKEALANELKARDNTPEAIAAREKRLKEEAQIAGHRVSPVFGSEQIFFFNLDKSQSAWGVIYRGMVNGRWYLLGGVLGLALIIIGGNWLRWRRLERTYLSSIQKE